MSRTGYYSHADCRKHEMGPGHPECPERLAAIEDRLLISGLDVALERREAPAATAADLELAHEPGYVAALGELARKLADSGSAYHSIDPDTALNPHTLNAALRAAGAALAATDAVLSGELQNAFCAVRPPGHHACHDRAMGFCFFNNVALAARHALDRHGLKRVAIIDFDVHHGNGTEDILAGDERVLMVGFFQHPFYPYSGAGQPASNMLNLPVPAYTRGAEIRELIESRWLPRLDEFKPEMLFISAGFDAHREDDLGQLGLTEQDYGWITERLVQLAQRHAQGRIVSCLEGGYSLSALGRSVEAHLRALAQV